MRQSTPVFCLSSIAAAVAAALASGTAAAQNAESAANGAGEEIEEVVVTGFRRSLADATAAKREAVGFVDAVFAEDIGKFPDTNIAESFNRIPGITINREITGEGLNVAIRGLNTNFTRVLLNNAPVAIASAGQDNAAQNREVDLDMFPPELFSQLSVYKTPSADMIEGGAAGTINMRMARPFDREGNGLTYSFQGIDNEKAEDNGARGSLIASYKFGETFGVLAGVSVVRNKVAATGFETVGWTSLNLTQAQCGGGTLPCNTTLGTGAGPGQISTVPDNPSTVAAGLTPGAAIDNAFLLVQNPGRTIRQIDNAIMPRLGRPMFDVGDRDRNSAVLSFEFRPTDSMHLFLDSMYGKKENELERVDMMWGVRRTSQGGLIIPQNMQVDREDCTNGCVVTSATFPNSLMILEYRPYNEELEFWGTNPGLEWQIADKLKLEVQGNYTHSEFLREDPTVLAISQPTTVTYTNNGGLPSIVSSIDVNDPASFAWSVGNRGGGIEVGRVDMVDEARETETMGGRFSLSWGDDDLNLKVGAAYDDVSRDIRPLSNTQEWQNATCGGAPSVFLPGPNRQPPCRGDLAGQIVTSPNVGQPYPSYPALGTGYSAGYPTPLTYGGSLVPNAAVPNYLVPSRFGFVSVNWDDFKDASNYDAIRARETEAGATPVTANWATIQEKSTGFFTQLNGITELRDKRLRYNLGVRYVETEQSVTSRLTGTDPRNPVAPASGNPDPADGSYYPQVVTIATRDTKYHNFLPSGTVAWNVTDDFILRSGVSKTMTRPNPGDLRSGIAFPNADASSASLGNPDLTPYLSTNFDFGFEFYTGDEGYFGVAAFRKSIKGFTFLLQDPFRTFGSLAQYGANFNALGASQQAALRNRALAQTNGASDDPNIALVRLDQTINAEGKLIVNGLEFNWVQPLDFLLGRIGMKGFGFTANYTFIDQRPKGTGAPPLALGVPPETFNATLYYENHGVSARVSVTSAQGSQGTGPNSNQQGVQGAEVFGQDYRQVDFSSSFDFSEMFGWSEYVPQLTIDGINVTNQTRRSYFQYTNATNNMFNAGRTFMVGLRGRF
jgi:TonB-dependent receptor